MFSWGKQKFASVKADKAVQEASLFLNNWYLREVLLLNDIV